MLICEELYLLDTKEKVALANEYVKAYPRWRLGDHCPVRPEKKVSKPVATKSERLYWANLELQRAGAEMSRLVAFIEDVAGMDCASYTKHLQDKPCGRCVSCRARGVLTLEYHHE